MAHFDAERRILRTQLRHRLEEIASTIYTQRTPIGSWEASETGQKQGPSRPPETGWKPFQIGSVWGGYDITLWFRTRVVIPQEMAGKRVVALVRPGGEALAYLNGEPAQGLDGNRDAILLTPEAQGGETFDLIVEAYSSPRFDQKHTFQYADLAVVNEQVWEFYWDVRVAYDTLEVLAENSAPFIRLLDLIDRCVRMLDFQHLGSEAYFASFEAAHQAFREGIQAFQESTGLGTLILTGHSHIDTAWLWPLRETRRKCARTFSSVIKYMDEYPEYRFSQSQPQLYEFVKRDYPELYERIKQRVKEGRWEPVGATWVEQDSNISSGESLVRQFLYGNRFFRQEFGVHSRTCWLPDAFGFCWSLPQIMKRAGVDFFATTKIDWSQYTKFPYSLFWWQGIDGTRVLAVMPPLNYNGNPTPRNCLSQWEQFRQKDQADAIVFSIGWGDGGGGPTKEMLEYGRRLKNMVGVPRCEFGTVQGFFDRIVQQIDPDRLPVWNGELYLELHRACQTTQGRTKRNNRKSELLYRDAEFVASAAFLLGASYPQDRLVEGWKVILCNQFHDILPGSSIHEVYEDADKHYAEVQQIGREVRDQALGLILERIDTRGEGIPLVVINTLSWQRTDVAEAWVPIEGDFHIVNDSGEVVASQVVEQKDGQSRVLFEARDLPSLGYAVYRVLPGAGPETPSGLQATERTLENDYYRIALAEDGTLQEVYDKLAQRSVLPEGKRANILQLFDDRPHANDAWDIDFNYEDKMWEMDQVQSIELVESGPVRATLRVVKQTEKSTIRQDICLYDKVPRIDFITHADWWEKHTLLKVAFPVDVLSPKATYEIQFGTIERNTHWNTDWDRARFEVPAQRWMDLSEGDYGVSVLNDCKYGCDVHENVLRLSLLRSPTSPDPQADEGQHEFIYSLYPHRGDWRRGHTVQRAAELNSPLLVQVGSPHAGDLPKRLSFATCDREHVILDTVKKAEDSDAIIVRVYEAWGQRGEVTLDFCYPLARVIECNLMEEDEAEIATDGRRFRFYIKPYQIRTFKLIAATA